MEWVALVCGIAPQDVLEAAAARLKDAPAVAYSYARKEGDDDPVKVKVLFKRPKLLRWEDDTTQVVADGKSIWTYDKDDKEYSTAGEIEDAIDEDPVLALCRGKLPKDVASRKEKNFDVLSWKVKDEDETIETTLWIDENKNIVKAKRKNADEVVVFEYAAIDLAPKFAEDAFVFKPPKGAKESVPDTGLEKSLLAVGAEAPDFEALDLDGKPVKLSEFKGKTVLLNFWFYY